MQTCGQYLAVETGLGCIRCRRLAITTSHSNCGFSSGSKSFNNCFKGEVSEEKRVCIRCSFLSLLNILQYLNRPAMPSFPRSTSSSQVGQYSCICLPGCLSNLLTLELLLVDPLRERAEAELERHSLSLKSALPFLVLVPRGVVDWVNNLLTFGGDFSFLPIKLF